MDILFHNKKRKILNLLEIKGRIGPFSTENIQIQEFKGLKVSLMSELDFLLFTGDSGEKIDYYGRLAKESNS